MLLTKVIRDDENSIGDLMTTTHHISSMVMSVVKFHVVVGEMQ